MLSQEEFDKLCVGDPELGRHVKENRIVMDHLMYLDEGESYSEDSIIYTVTKKTPTKVAGLNAIELSFDTQEATGDNRARG